VAVVLDADEMILIMGASLGKGKDWARDLS
jgi:hypothetical protein